MRNQISRKNLESLNLVLTKLSHMLESKSIIL